MLQAEGMGREKILICTNLGYVSHLRGPGSERPGCRVRKERQEGRSTKQKPCSNDQVHVHSKS